MTRAALIYIDNRYVQQGDLDLGRLFGVFDLTAIVRDKQDHVHAELARMRAMPAIDIGLHCLDHYEQLQKRKIVAQGWSELGDHTDLYNDKERDVRREIGKILSIRKSTQ